MKMIQQYTAGILGAGLGLALIATGCANSKIGALADSGARITELDLVTMPVAVSAGAQTQVEGVSMKVYAIDPARPKTQPIRKGEVQLLMFDGINRDHLADTNQCRQVWTFSSRELSSYSFETTVGTGYFFSLGWGTNRPQTDRVTIVARYRPQEGRMVYSTPSYIAVPVPSAVK